MHDLAKTQFIQANTEIRQLNFSHNKVGAQYSKGRNEFHLNKIYVYGVHMQELNAESEFMATLVSVWNKGWLASELAQELVVLASHRSINK